MSKGPIRIVPFDGLWKMAIDVPYSMLAGRGPSAWSCGQLAMDPEAQVVAPGDIAAQCDVVADYIENILRRAGLQRTGIRRLVLYYVRSNAGDRTRTVEIFRTRFGKDVVIDAVAIPEFYYEGVMLEVDVFCGPPLLETSRPVFAGGTAQIGLTQSDAWVSLEAPINKVAGAMQELKRHLAHFGITADNALNEHWIAPSRDLSDFVESGVGLGLGVDPFAILDGGPDIDHISMRATILRGGTVSGRVQDIDGVRIVTRHCGADAWLQARSLDHNAGLVDQTRNVMHTFEKEHTRIGVSFSDVVKQTAHYVGGTADELHDNMSVRNAFYSKPGPASTGIPVFGYRDPTTHTIVDLRVRQAWRE